MAGGTWASQNKVLPGVYINVSSQGNITTSFSDRGVVAMAEPLSWGPTGVLSEYTPGQDPTDLIGYPMTSPKALFINEIFRGTDRTAAPRLLYLYRPAGTGGAEATATIGSLTVTARYEGVRGNDISIIISQDPDEESSYIVETVIDGTVADSQTVTDLSQLVANRWVEFSGTGTTIEETAGKALTGGIDPTVAAADYAAFLTALEPYQFDILIYDGEDSTTKTAIASFVQRVSNNIGQKCQAVMADADTDNEFVISVENGFTLQDGASLTPQQATWWVGGAEAGATYYQSLTYAKHPYAVAANPKLTEAELTAAVQAGQIAFTDTFDSVKICQDINTLTTFTLSKGQEFSKNRVMRVLMQFCNDTYQYFSQTFIGSTNNNEDGRNLLKSWIVQYLNEMQANGGIQNFAADDVTVQPGDTIESVLINVMIQPVDSIEKIYMSVTVTTSVEGGE